MVLAAKQTHEPVEENQESRYKPIFILANNFWQKSQKHTVEKEASLINGAGKTGKPPAKEWN